MRARRRGTSTPARRCASRSSWKSCRTWSSDSSLPSRRPEMGRKVKKIRRAHPRPALAILSRKKTLYSTRRLIEAAKARSFRTRVIDVLRCNLALESGNPRLYHKGKEVRGIGVALPRIGASVTAAGLSVARQLEAMGVPLVNGASAIARSRDKLASLQALAAAGVRIPRTVLARGGGDVKELVAQVGGLPAILKLIQGTQGVGVMIAHSVAEVTSILSTLWDLGQEILLQEDLLAQVPERGEDAGHLSLAVRDHHAHPLRALDQFEDRRQPPHLRDQLLHIAAAAGQGRTRTAH